MGLTLKKLAKRSPKSSTELKAIIIDEWKKILSAYDLQNLVNSMKRRMEAVYDANGSHTKY